VLRLKQFREAKGYSQRQLTALAKVRKATISASEKGETSGVEFEELEKLASALGVNAAVLIDHAPPPPPSKKRGAS
jgi:transcriptional regulator with XRE-family HTH domain